jgi:hypothetical protein
VVVRGAAQALTRCLAGVGAPQPRTQRWLGARFAGRIKLQTHLAEALLGAAAGEDRFDRRKLISI